MLDTIIKNGRIVTAERVIFGSVLIKDGVICGIATDELSGQGAGTVIDAQGRLVLPGMIDTHVHFSCEVDGEREDYAHGTAAAALGGVSTVVDMPMQVSPALVSQEALAYKLKQVKSEAYVDYAFWGGLTEGSISELRALHDGGCATFKAFFAPTSSRYSPVSYGQARRALEILKGLSARAGFHCEDLSICNEMDRMLKDKADATWQDFFASRPLVAELIATESVLALAQELGAKIHICHVSHPDVAELIRAAQRNGVDVTAETCTHYLVFSEDDVYQKGGLYKCVPPLRKKEDAERLWRYVLDGTIGCVCSDHSPAGREAKDEKNQGVLNVHNGISGVQTSMQVFFSEAVHKRGHCPTLLARALSQNPARAFSLHQHKGAIAPGFDADLVLLDDRASWRIDASTLAYVQKISAYDGFQGTGLIEQVLLRGRTVAKDGQLLGEKGYGRFVPRG